MIARMQRWFWQQLGHWCHVAKQYDTALKYYGLALALTPDDPKLLATIGFEMMQQQRSREALAMFDRALQRKPDWPEVQFGRGFLLQQMNDHDAALAAFDLALAGNPDHDRALYGKALSLIALQRKDEAVAPLERNTRLQPMSPYGWYQLARVEFDRGKPDKTRAIIEHLATFEPKVAAQLARETGLPAPPRP
ncbi:MAG: tetratricopeptide repeat protein [Burkholderiales bacterium]